VQNLTFDFAKQRRDMLIVKRQLQTHKQHTLLNPLKDRGVNWLHSAIQV